MTPTNDHPSITGYDFGDDDADVVLPDDPGFDAWIAAEAPRVNAPSRAPRDLMWSEIATRVPAIAQPAAPVRMLPFRRPRILMPAALAAALILGIGIDRVIPRQRTAPPEPVTARSQASSPPTDTHHLYQLAAQQTLTQAEALLTAYRASGSATRDPEGVKQLTLWGRQVLSSTRLLIDSPAGDDPRLRPLLEDLEVVLVQIIQLSGEPLDASERALIDGAITSRQLLPRIRSAVPAGNGDAATD